MGEPSLASWGLVALIEWEIALSYAFLAGVCPSLVRKIAFIVFTTLTGVALSKMASNAISCACAGDLVAISPKVAVGADLLILAGLAWWRPGVASGVGLPRAALTVALLPILAFPLIAALRPIPYPRLVVAPFTDIGELAAGERRSFRIAVRNPHDQAVDIVAVESSCPCLDAEQVPFRIGPGESGTLHLRRIWLASLVSPGR